MARETLSISRRFFSGLRPSMILIKAMGTIHSST
jgi:hypothetical protein